MAVRQLGQLCGYPWLIYIRIITAQACSWYRRHLWNNRTFILLVYFSHIFIAWYHTLMTFHFDCWQISTSAVWQYWAGSIHQVSYWRSRQVKKLNEKIISGILIIDFLFDFFWGGGENCNIYIFVLSCKIIIKRNLHYTKNILTIRLQWHWELFKLREWWSLKKINLRKTALKTVW